MGFWDFLKGPAPSHAAFTPNVTHLGPDSIGELLLGDMTPAEMWSSQPHLRTVISFLARNIAQLGLHTFERSGEDRQRDRSSTFAATMRRPNEDQTAYDLVFALVGDLALYDRAYWLTVPDAESASGWMFRRLPPPWVTPVPRDAFGAGSYRIISTNGKSVEVPATDVLSFSGYHPSNPWKGSPTVEALKGTLREQIEASKYRNQVWKRGGRASAVIQRPAGATWSDAAAERFRSDWYAKYTGDGALAGGTPILEDGMTLNRIDFSASEQQFVESAKLAFSTVASAFHVNPTMVGILENANYSNVREFRRMLYGDTLGPIIAMIEDRINTFLLPRLGMDNAAFYAEFNIGEKLQGSFEEQAAVMSTLVGRPVMTADEGRAKFNLPALGGDAAGLVTPLNVLVGGQASSRDSGSQNLNAREALSLKSTGAKVKARAPESHEEKHRQVLAAFFKRQGQVVGSRLGGAASGWDEERWNRELGSDLLSLALTTTEAAGLATLLASGRSANDYNVDRTIEFLKVATSNNAQQINATTRSQVDAALNDDDDPAGAVGHVFEIASESRAGQIAATAVTFASSFGAHEAANQNAEGATKTWIVTSQNPRASHRRMNNETVALSEDFSNGLPWPGGIGGDVEDTAGCKCELEINFP